jgi:molybdopterin molybdotransferase
VAAARERLGAVRPPLSVEWVPTVEAVGRTVAAPVHARVALPPFARAAMDGYAVRTEDLSRLDTVLPVGGRTLAGEPPGQMLPHQAWRIFTGAPLPVGADAVVEQEAVELLGPRVRVSRAVRAGRNVMPQGHELPDGGRLVDVGERLSVLHLGVLAAAGLERVPVWQRPAVAIVEVGSELEPLGAVLAPGHIYGVHRVWLPAAVREFGGEVRSVVSVADEPQAITQALEQAWASAPLVITTGGVSVGDADFLPDILARVATRLFWRVAMHPGKAVAAAHQGYERLAIALSGNPGAAFLSWLVLVSPWWAAWHRGQLAVPHAVLPLVDGFDRPTRETRYLRVKRGADGIYVSPSQSADALTSYLVADGLAVVPEQSPPVAPGTLLPFCQPPGMGGREPAWTATARREPLGPAC